MGGRQRRAHVKCKGPINNNTRSRVGYALAPSAPLARVGRALAPLLARVGYALAPSILVRIDRTLALSALSRIVRRRLGRLAMATHPPRDVDLATAARPSRPHAPLAPRPTTASRARRRSRRRAHTTHDLTQHAREPHSCRIRSRADHRPRCRARAAAGICAYIPRVHSLTARRFTACSLITSLLHRPRPTSSKTLRALSAYLGQDTPQSCRRPHRHRTRFCSAGRRAAARPRLAGRAWRR